MADRSATTSRKKSGRKRRVAGWLLLAIGVLVTGVWGASRLWTFGVAGPNWAASADGGKLRVQAYTSNVFSSPGWFGMQNSSNNWSWTLTGRTWKTAGPAISFESWIFSYAEGFSQPTSQGRGSLAILWPFALASLLGGGWLLRSGRRARRRAMTGVCLKCGYDLRGLAVGAPCPECGVAQPRPRGRLNQWPIVLP